MPVNLIALCPSCHAQADDGEITRAFLKELKACQIGAEKVGEHKDIRPHDALALSDEEFLQHLREWHRRFVYKGRIAQFRDYLTQINGLLRTRGEIASVKGAAVLATRGGILRRSGGDYFLSARSDLGEAEIIVKDLGKSMWDGELLGRIYYDLGYIGLLSSDYGTALRLFRQGEESDRNSGKKIGMRITGSVKEQVLGRERDNYHSQRLKEHLKFFSDTDHPDARRWVTNTHMHLAEFCLANSDPYSAIAHLEEASSNYDTLGLISARGKLMYLYGRAFLELHESSRALSALDAAYHSYRQLHRMESFSDVCYAYGQALEKNDRKEEALHKYKLGVTLDPDMDNKTGIRKCGASIKALTEI